MVCDTRPIQRNQTIQERAAQVRSVVERLEKMLMRRTVKPVVGSQGAITFSGWSSEDRANVSDACAYRIIMRTGGMLAKAEIARAEQLAGRTVSRDALVQGVHSHDGGKTWGNH